MRPPWREIRDTEDLLSHSRRDRRPDLSTGFRRCSWSVRSRRHPGRRLQSAPSPGGLRPEQGRVQCTERRYALSRTSQSPCREEIALLAGCPAPLLRELCCQTRRRNRGVSSLALQRACARVEKGVFLRRTGHVQRRCQTAQRDPGRFEYREITATRPSTWGRSAHSSVARESQSGSPSTVKRCHTDGAVLKVLLNFEKLSAHGMYEPPFTCTVCPVMWRASSLARNTATEAMSSGCAMRPSGTALAITASSSSLLP